MTNELAERLRGANPVPTTEAVAPDVSLLVRIVATPRHAAEHPRSRQQHLISEARAALAAGSPSRRTGRGRISRRRFPLIALAAALALAVVLAIPALGVVRDVASWLAGLKGPDEPVPTAPDVVIASGQAGVPWRIIATPSDQGLCLFLVTQVKGERAGSGGCGYSDIRGNLPPDLRGDPSARCLGTPTSLVPCGSLPRHWVDAAGASGVADPEHDRIIVFAPAAEEVASVDLVLTNGRTLRAHLIEHPNGIDAPLNFYWAALGPREGVVLTSLGGVAEPRGDLVKMVIARDSVGRVLERRVPSWNGNPEGDPNEPPAPGATP